MCFESTFMVNMNWSRIKAKIVFDKLTIGYYKAPEQNPIQSLKSQVLSILMYIILM